MLVVEDSDDDYQILLREVRRGGYAVSAERVCTAGALADALTRPWDVMISDWVMPAFGGLAALELVRGRDLPCIVISGTPDEEEAMAAIHAGALDFISKERPLRFVPAIERALREQAMRRERAAVERELRLSEERYRSVFETAPEALLALALDGRVLDANPAAQRLFGRGLDQLRQVALDAALVARIAAASGAPFEASIGDARGDAIPVEIHVARLGTGNAARVALIDLRERRKLDVERRRSVELELQNRRIQEANRLKSEFLANMSHELRTPLNAIIGFAELLYDGQVSPDVPEHREFLGDILNSSRHLLQLINDVLDLAKVEAGKLDFRPVRCELAAVLAEVIATTRTQAAAKRIVVSLEVDAAPRDVTIDPARLKQVAYNFVSNALKFTPEDGNVTIRATRHDAVWFKLEVEDTGIGIAQDDLERLFVEFEQLEAGASKRHAGTGLGLALTRRLVEAQGGSVGVRSMHGAGSVFHAILPIEHHA
jgi:signal transduction histidine kinase